MSQNQKQVNKFKYEDNKDKDLSLEQSPDQLLKQKNDLSITE